VGWSGGAERISLPGTILTRSYGALARPGGAFAMLALDQRISLRNIFVDAGLEPRQEALDGFRTTVASTLSPIASAILLDPGYIARAPEPAPWADGGGLIVAADELIQDAGQPARDSRLELAAAGVAVARGATALKLMVIWDSRETNEDRLALVREFVALAHEHGLVAITEGIVPADPDGTPATAEELLTATAALSRGADLYKAQVPIHGGDSLADVERLSAELTAILPCPWVVLSTGVPHERFADLVGAACRGGASGVLAGRAIWRAAVGRPDPAGYLSNDGTARLEELIAVVDAEARPWVEAVGMTADA
jgi:sulfofructosephosphate aldolase